MFKEIKIIYKKLGRNKVHGYAYKDGTIEIDSRLKGKKHLEILLHEIFHVFNYRESEEKIVLKSVTLTKILWEQGYRRIDNTNEIPLQDGSE